MSSVFSVVKLKFLHLCSFLLKFIVDKGLGCSVETTIDINGLTEKVIGCIIEVHKHLGPGLLESTYEQCLAHELTINSIRFELQKSMPVMYKGIKLDCGYRIDMIIENDLIIELKSVEYITDIHMSQIITYLKLSHKKLGLIVNFNTRLIKNGIKRVAL